MPMELNKKCMVLVFGTGKICKRYRKSLSSMEITAFLDNDYKKHGTLLWGKKIYEPSVGVRKFNFDKVYIMASDIYIISKQLRNLGIPAEKIESYLSFESELGDNIFRDKIPKIPYEIIRRAINGNVAVFPDNHSALRIFGFICSNLTVIEDESIPENIDLIAYHGLGMSDQKASVYEIAKERKIPVAFFEDGFLRSVIPCGFHGKDEWTIGRSILLDGRGLYINAFSESEFEKVLNSDFCLSEEEQKRAKMLMSVIIGNNISKYNNQPAKSLSIGRRNATKVLVIDQVPNDRSIKYGLAYESTFLEMLNAAIEENPDADILIKTHPATQTSHYNEIEKDDNENIYIVDYPINPIILLKYVDKVYVCTSQMGFEALMCGKEVHVFGMPFYAGWGVTNDRIICSRRHVKRSIEEIFYVAYVLLPIYISTKKGKCCEIEDVIEELIGLREEYFSSLIEDK